MNSTSKFHVDMDAATCSLKMMEKGSGGEEEEGGGAGEGKCGRLAEWSGYEKAGECLRS